LDADQSQVECKAIEFDQNNPFIFEANNSADDNNKAIEQNTFDYDRLPIIIANENRNEPAPNLFEYECETNQTNVKE